MAVTAWIHGFEVIGETATEEITLWTVSYMGISAAQRRSIGSRHEVQLNLALGLTTAQRSTSVGNGITSAAALKGVTIAQLSDIKGA